MDTKTAVYYTHLTRHVPNREDIIHVTGNFCNVFDADGWPIFDAFVDWLFYNNKTKANDWVSRLKDVGTKHWNLDLSGDYNENLGWAPRYPVPGTDWTNNLDGLCRVIDWLESLGFIVKLNLATDGQGYDPNGLTYGWSWAMQNLPRILTYIKQRFSKSILYTTGWDGCFPNHSPQQTTQLLQLMRAVLGDDEQIATEFNGPGGISYSHMGKGPADWVPNSLGILDAFLIEISVIDSEFDVNEVGLQQTYARLLGPAKKNIAPENDGPYFLASLQKEIAIIDFENIAYQISRKTATYQNALDVANRSKFYGCKYFGNGIV